MAKSGGQSGAELAGWLLLGGVVAGGIWYAVRLSQTSAQAARTRQILALSSLGASNPYGSYPLAGTTLPPNPYATQTPGLGTGVSSAASSGQLPTTLQASPYPNTLV